MPTRPVQGGSLNTWGTELNAWLDKVLPFNVNDYGAKGDGTTDDTTAIQAAINAAGTATGGTVLFPRGIYKITATLTVPNFVTLMGACETQRSPEYGIVVSTASQILIGTSGNFTAVTNSDHVNGNTSIGIQNLYFEGRNMISDLPIVNFATCRRFIVDRCYFIGAATTSRQGLNVVTASEMYRISDTFFEGCGITIDTASSAVIRDCEVGQGGIIITNSFYCQVKGCQIYNNGTAAGVDYPAWRTGIYLNKCTEALIDGNQVLAFSRDGIALDSSKRCHVTNNTCIDNSRLISGTWAGIFLETGTGSGNDCQENLIQGNECYNRLGTTQKSGLRITQTVGATANNRIFDNNFRGNQTEEITTNGFVNNTVRNPGAVKTYSGGGATQATDAPAVEMFTMNITNNTAFTISSPTNPTTGAILTYDIKNSSGGAMGAITWGAAFLLAGAFTNPANTKRRTISFYYDGTNWVETNRAAADI